ncbi:MAG: AAA-like domain-containing protein, partial [bacterium]
MSHPSQTNKEFYVVGGTMRPESPSYIKREADRKLYKHIKAGDFCYIFTSRQMGKSSLMARTAKRLQEEGTSTVILDLTMIGAEKAKRSADRWYYGIAHQIIRELNLKLDLLAWWKSRGNLSSLQRLMEFLKDVVLGNIPGKVVIFVDEIDTTISLPFTDDFFAAIRACYNSRATEPEYNRLSFVLLGVASPSQLIKDTRRTPFNIGYHIDLTDFTFEEARPLARYLCLDQSTRDKALKRILYWTGGHPYLTQKLCRALNTEKIKSCSDEDVDRVVKKQFLTPEAETQDHNLSFVRDRLSRAGECSTRELLKIYRGIYKGATVMDDPLSPVHTALKLSSVIVPRDGRRLSVRNRIYKQVFTPAWVKDAMPVNWTLWTGTAAFLIIVLGFGFWYLALLP